MRWKNKCMCVASPGYLHCWSTVEVQPAIPKGLQLSTAVARIMESHLRTSRPSTRSVDRKGMKRQWTEVARLTTEAGLRLQYAGQIGRTRCDQGALQPGIPRA